MVFSTLEYPKVIGDPIHGYIPITKLEYDLLQLPAMNRLHHIRQTGLAFQVFPGSVTSRFSHVVGALHVGGKLVSQILAKLEQTEFKNLFPEGLSPDLLIKSVRLSCLFHDIGHGPFSHSAEETMLKVTKQKYSEEIQEAKKLFDENKEEKVPIHEFFSYKLVTNGDIRDLIITKEGEDAGNLLIDSIACLLVKSSDKFVQKNPGYGLLRRLVSSQLDADRMDYLLRDSTMSGVKYGLVDVDRIINNMKILKNKIVIHERALGAIEDMLDARYKMYRWFYSHHTNVLLNELIKMAVDKITAEESTVANLFHWSSFMKGTSTDDQILDLISNKMEATTYLRFKGLFDRRYLPVSIFKSTPDQGRLIRKIRNGIDIQEDYELVKKRIFNFFRYKGEELLKTKFDQVDELRDIIIFQATPVITPYEPFSENESDKVYLYRSDEDKLCELWSESTYFKKINEEWKNYRGLYFYYLFPGKRKEEFSVHKNKVFNIISDEIINSYSHS